MSRRPPNTNLKAKKESSNEHSQKKEDEKPDVSYGSLKDYRNNLGNNNKSEEGNKCRNVEKDPSHDRKLASEEENSRVGRGRGRGRPGFSSSNGRGGGRGRGESREGRGRTNPRGRSTNTNRQQQHQQCYNSNYKGNKNSNKTNDHLTEQDVLIAFMPFLRHDKDQEAVKIYEIFQITGDHDTFVQQARQLILAKRQQKAAPLTDSQQPEKSVDDEEKPTETVTVDDRIPALDITANHIEGPESLQEENKNNTEVGSPSICDIRTQKQKTAPTEEKEKVQVDEEETQCGQEQPSTVGKPAVVHLPKRIIRNQPGTIVISGASTNRLQQVFVRPRQEIEARWSIPLSHIRLLVANAAADKKQDSNACLEVSSTDKETSIDAADGTTSLQQLEKEIRSRLYLCIGLFRLGTEINYNVASKQNTSIISKEVGNFQFVKSRQDNPATNDETLVLTGRVPFYAPRTPGNVIFRMYMESNPVATLATSSPIVIHLLDPQQDLDPTLRFVLSGIKSRKGSALGSLCTVASILSSWVAVVSASSAGDKRDYLYCEAAGRALWGCICECRKLVENSKDDHQSRMEKLMERLDALSEQQQQVAAANIQEGDEDEEDEVSSNHLDAVNIIVEDESAGNINELKSEPKVVMIKKLVSARKEKARLEKNWHDVQAAFASIIHTIISNEQAMLALLRPDAINKLRVEYELWCPICEQSAPVPTKIISASSFVESKREMQQSILGFIPDERVIVFATNNESLVERHSKASSVLTLLTTSMHCLYETELSPTSDFYRTREKVRLEMERFVNTHCSAYFPLGSRVMVFGSSANGFGSPTSDLDMCLQLPQSERNADLSSDDWFATKGRDAMQALADTLTSHGMKEVDTCRLTARIPVIMFRYPLPLTATGEEPLLDCDISMRNPLALLNTQFLRIYSMLDPRIPVLASTIKRWAKSRCINDPKTHTLSSYGYLIMLLHFLLLRRKQGMCLPNLLYTDPGWKYDKEYNELDIRPVIDSLMFPHPNEDAYMVNAYFYQPRDESALRSLQRVVSGDQARTNYIDSDITCSAGFLLAEFFRYYAYEFDYKHHVISLHSGGRSRGFVEKEMKGEFDGWKIGLGIEDPFERFYNVAHVVTGTQLRRIRKEFALAYTKISSRCLMEKNDRKLKDYEDDLLVFLCEEE